MCVSSSPDYSPTAYPGLRPSRSRSFGSQLNLVNDELPPQLRDSSSGYIPKGTAKFQSILNVGYRIMVLPILALRFVYELRQRVVYKEPKGYRSPPKRRSKRAAFKSACVQGVKAVKATSKSVCNGAFALERNMEEEIKIVVGRFWESTYDSYMLTLQAVIYYSSLYFMWFFGVQDVLFHWQKDIEYLLAWCAGAMYTTKDGETLPFSILSSMDPEYTVPYNVVQKFPFGPETDAPENAHFLALCSKLVYEDCRIIQDMVENKWGMTFHDYFHAPAHWTTDCWVPDMVWFTCSNAHAIIITFKGADPLWQVNLKADPPISKSYYKSFRCHLHGGLMRGLGQPNPYDPNETIFETIIDSLRVDGAGKKIFVCGHSLGGGLSSLFSLLTHKRHKEMDDQIQGVFTYAGPRFGDKSFSKLFSELFEGRAFRYVNAADVVCKLPPGNGYAHHQKARLITSYPTKTNRGETRVLKEEEEPNLLKFHETREDRWGYYYSVCKLWDNCCGTAGENNIRLMFRSMLLATPGFSDHFPCDYERALREELSRDHRRAIAASIPLISKNKTLCYASDDDEDLIPIAG